MFNITVYFNRRLVGEPHMLTVHKEHLWRDAFMFYKGAMTAIHDTQPLCVVFEGDCDLVERSKDGGGP